MKGNRDRENALVFIVDDNEAHRITTRAALEQAGYLVDEASNGQEALSAVERILPDLTLLDIMMPNIDGFTVCSELRGNPQFRNLPIVMMTALDDLESIRRAFELGATNFITKPINWRLLPYQVKYILASSQNEDELRMAKALLKASRVAR